jgi:hypothetical protein
MHPEAPSEMCKRVDWNLAKIVILQKLVLLCVKMIHVCSLANLGFSSPILSFICTVLTSLLMMNLAEMVEVIIIR